MRWTPKQMPDQDGRTFVITGANSGIGFHAAKHLVRRGANVVLACRRLHAAEAAVRRIGACRGEATAMHLDLADLDSVAAFAQDAPGRIDVLVNNAGIMMVPYATTRQGYESQWGINVVGPARLTKALLPRVQDRVVTISSIAHRRGRIDPGSWQDPDVYDPWEAYAQSKLGDLMFALALQRHLDAHRPGLRSVAAHPGVSLTRLAKDVPWALKLSMLFYVPFLQSGDKGSWPTLYAATQDVPGGSYWGPQGPKEYRGAPGPARVEDHARDEAVQAQVWDGVW